MRPRRAVIRDALAPTGVLIVAVDDRAHHLMRALLDDLFGETLHLATVVVDSGLTKNRSNYVAAGHSCLLIYARNRAAYERAVPAWRDQREGIDEVLAAARAIWAEFGPDRDEARRRMRAWWVAVPTRSVLRGLVRYSHFLPNGRLARDDNAGSPHPGGRVYELRNPTTGKRVTMPANGWRYDEARMRKLDAAGQLHWGSTTVAILRPLDADAGTVPRSVETVNPTAATRHLAKLLGERPQGVFPKDHRHLARWLRLVTGGKSNAVVLDAFAGTGSVAEAVMLLNAADGGTRRSISIEISPDTVDRLLVPRLHAAARLYPGERVVSVGDPVQ